MSVPTFLPLTTYREFSTQEMVSRVRSFRDEMVRRPTVRQFSSRRIPREVIEDCLSVARGAPSGANKQPCHFVVVKKGQKGTGQQKGSVPRNEVRRPLAALTL
jgi:Nitroreductase family